MTQPLVSIIIVNWNGHKWLGKCLRSLEVQTYKNFEVIFVDNASTDDSVAYVRKNFPGVKVIETGSNLGFAGGNNIGYSNSVGDYILLLNNDTFVPEDYLEVFIRVFDVIPNVGSAQSKLVLMDKRDTLDVCGSYWTASTFLYHYGYAQDATDSKFNNPLPVFSNKGAAMLIRRDVIEKIGLFDVDFWCYYEETDFCHRVWLAGYECWYYPAVTCYHAMGGSSKLFDNSFIQFHNFKNKLISFLKNFSFSNLIWIVPTYFLINVILSLLWLVQRRWKHVFALWNAIFWNIVHFKETLHKRKLVQALRTQSDKSLLRRVMINPPARYYYYLFVGLNKYKESWYHK